MAKEYSTENPFWIANDTRIRFGFIDRLRILFGKETKVSIRLFVDKEVKIIHPKTEHSVNVKRIFPRREKGVFGLISTNVNDRNQNSCDKREK